ncbi:hypothetical protein [Erwinia sp. CGal63]|uniref:hypothetical protein n=1 Tax=Erwinia sp. CGal63 TaxID=2919889 RepID=UPI00300A7881
MRMLMDFEIASVSGAGSCDSTTTTTGGSPVAPREPAAGMTGKAMLSDGSKYESAYEGDIFAAWDAWNAQLETLSGRTYSVFAVHGNNNSSASAIAL